jgi:hypothetical protein
MNTKLTLRLDEDIIIRIKNFAGRQQLSLSKFTENLFRQILDNSEDNMQNLSPIVKKYKGIIKKINTDDSEDLIEYLTEKHS